MEILNLRQDLEEVAGVYAEVFAGSPWNEYTLCSKEDKYFGLETKPGSCCPSCGSELLTEAYPKESTVKKILKEITRSRAVSLVKRDEAGNIIAFSWGFSYQGPEEFAQDKYPEYMRPKIVDILRASGVNNELFYLSETGIIDKFRGRGWTNDFYRERLKVAQTNNLPVVVRTNCESPISAVVETFGFTQIMGPRVMVDRSQRKIIVTDDLVNKYRDEFIPGRVLFVLPNQKD